MIIILAYRHYRTLISLRQDGGRRKDFSFRISACIREAAGQGQTFNYKMAPKTETRSPQNRTPLERTKRVIGLRSHHETGPPGLNYARDQAVERARISKRVRPRVSKPKRSGIFKGMPVSTVKPKRRSAYHFPPFADLHFKPVVTPISQTPRPKTVEAQQGGLDRPPPAQTAAASSR